MGNKVQSSFDAKPLTAWGVIEVLMYVAAQV